MKYSISYKNAAGITTRSDCVQFDTDEDASASAKQDLSKHALIEVWKGDHLLVRLEQTAKGVRV